MFGPTTGDKVRLADTDTQLKAKDVIEKALDHVDAKLPK